jgi:hypothetical protein
MSQTPADTVREQVSARRAAAGPMVPVLWCLLAALVTLASLPVALRASDSARLARRERARALAVVADVERLQALRASLAAEGAEGAHGTDDEQAGSLTLAARVSAVLAAAGLGQSSLAGLSPQSVVQRSDAGTALRVRATLTLQSVTLPEVGRFIAEWRSRHPAWTLTSIDLAPDAGAQTNVKITPGSDLPIRAVLVVESIAFDPHDDPHDDSHDVINSDSQP